MESRQDQNRPQGDQNQPPPPTPPPRQPSGEPEKLKSEVPPKEKPPKNGPGVPPTEAQGPGVLPWGHHGHVGGAHGEGQQQEEGARKHPDAKP